MRWSVIKEDGYYRAQHIHMIEDDAVIIEDKLPYMDAHLLANKLNAVTHVTES